MSWFQQLIEVPFLMGRDCLHPYDMRMCDALRYSSDSEHVVYFQGPQIFL